MPIAGCPVACELSMRNLISTRLHAVLGAVVALSGISACATPSAPALVAERHPPDSAPDRVDSRPREHAPGALANAAALTPLDAAVAARDRGDLLGAVQILENMGATDEHHAEVDLACALLGLTHFELNEYEEAGRVLSRCDRSGPVADLVAYVRAEVLRGLDRPLDAVKAYELAMSFPRSPNALKAQFRHADALFEAGQCDLAVPTYQKLLETFPESPSDADVRLRLAECGLKSGEKRRATETLAALTREVPSRDAGVAARLKLGHLRALGVPLPQYGFEDELRHAVALREARRWPEALVVLDGLTPTKPAQLALWHRERSKVLESLDRYADALAALEDAESDGAKDLEDSRIRLLRKLGRTDEAVKRSQKRVSSQRERLRIAADLYYRDGEYGKARREGIDESSAKIERSIGTIKEEVRELLRSSTGLSGEEIADLLRSKFAEIKSSRADAIGRTTATATTGKTQAAVWKTASDRESDPDRKIVRQWVSFPGARDAHSGANGQFEDPDTGFFTVGGEQTEYPAGPGLSAKNAVNCRCITRARRRADYDRLTQGG